MLATALKACGLKVGLYTSPHILAFNERIRINGTPVPDSALEAHLAELMPHALAYGTSYFETATAVALAHFAEERVDVEILEAGVGARLDATTAVDADMALITPIGIDHQAWLGDSLASIAEEKAWAMKGCRFSISAPQSPEVLQQLKAFNPGLATATVTAWLGLQTVGAHQFVNASLAFAAANTLMQNDIIDCSPEAIRDAINSCQVPGRLQRVQVEGAAVWLDAAHNRHAVEALLPSLKGLADPFDAILIFTREDRSLDDCLPLLAPYTDQLITRAESDAPLAALNTQLARQPHGSFLVLGSFITVADILRGLQQ